jgi:hypothetical protein
LTIVKIIALVLVLSWPGTAQNISIRMEAGVFKVVGWTPSAAAPSEGWQSILAVYAGPGDVPPMLGSYSIENQALVFRPRFPLSPGFRYRAVFRPSRPDAVETVFETPQSRATPTTRVEHVYPSSEILPANQLKFYLVFSKAMSRGEAWQRIHLLDSSGARISLPFLELGEELWDPGNRRLTVLFDPGRIKRGVMPREQIGPALESGKQYTLLIDRDWLDAQSQPLQAEFRKPFRVGPEDHSPIDPKQWNVHAPKAKTSDALIVNLARPMDYALLQRVLQVTGADGTLPGSVSIGRDETEWSFVPNEPWTAGQYYLRIDTSLEDLAGNRIGRAFDVDTFGPVTQQLTTKTVSLPFRISRQ